MKNLSITIQLTILGFIFFSGSLFGMGCINKKGETQKDSSYCIEIDGRVLIPQNDDQKLYKIELLCYNELVDSGVIVDDEPFLLKVKKNSWYTIRIIKEGYFTQVVSIDTRLPEYNKCEQTFHFDTELINLDETGIRDMDALDFPIAIVSFNRNIGRFSPVTEYSKNIKSSLFDLPALAHSYAKR
jgi:hypothetical protein